MSGVCSFQTCARSRSGISRGGTNAGAHLEEVALVALRNEHKAAIDVGDLEIRVVERVAREVEPASRVSAVSGVRQMRRTLLRG
jgi:hypothetical protein